MPRMYSSEGQLDHLISLGATKCKMFGSELSLSLRPLIRRSLEVRYDPNTNHLASSCVIAAGRGGDRVANCLAFAASLLSRKVVGSQDVRIHGSHSGSPSHEAGSGYQHSRGKRG